MSGTAPGSHSHYLELSQSHWRAGSGFGPLWRSGYLCKNVSRKCRLLKVFETRHSMFKEHSLHGNQFFFAVGASVVMLGFSDDAWSQQRRNDRTHEMVTAESLSGTGKITAPTRQGQFDREVRLPGGTWIPCKQDCQSTLRDESIDFWASRDRRSGGSSSDGGGSGGGGR